MELYAELTRKQLNLFDTGLMKFDLPGDFSLIRKKGSRACYFEGSDKASIEELQDHLDYMGIAWQ